MTTELATSNAAALDRLDLDRVRRAVADSAAENTRRSYGGALRRFADWLAVRGIDLADLDAEGADAAIAAYLADRADQGAAPATVALDFAAIGAAARDSRSADPRGPLSRRTLKGVKRQAAREAADGDARGRGQAAAFRWRAVEAAAVLAASDGSPAGLRDAALLRLGSDAFLRVSELAAVRVADLAEEADGSGRLTVRRSKTDQDAEGAVLFVGSPTMEAVRKWQAVSGVQDGFLFRRLSRAGKLYRDGSGLASKSIRRIIAARAEAAGVAGRVSGHSLRVGSAQSIVRAGGSTAELMQAGRWRDARTATGYARAELAGRGAVARLRYGSGE